MLIFNRAALRRSYLLALSLSTILAGGAALPAMAQDAAPAPVRQSIDGNGVDLFRGTMTVQAPSLTIGGSTQGMAYQAINRGGAWSDTISAGLNLDGSVMTVSIGGVSDAFTVSGGSYAATQGNGATLTFDATSKIYSYTSSDGTVATFLQDRTSPMSNQGRVTAIARPSGERLSYNYQGLTYCSSTKPGSDGDICLARSTVYRLASVGNGYGYRLTLDHPELDPVDPDDTTQPDFATWYKVLGVTASNLAVAGGATVSQTFGTATSGGVTTFEVTDALSRTTTYRLGNAGVVGMRRPGATTDDVTIGYAGGKVSSVTSVVSGVTNYAWSDAGAERTATVTDALSQASVYTFDIASQRMTSMTDALGHKTRWEHDAAGRVTRTIAPEGNAVRSSYDARGNVTERRIVSKTPGTPPDIVTTASYAATCGTAATCNQPTSTTDARGGVTDYTYDPASGDVLSVTAPAATAGGVRPQTRYGYTSLQAYYSNGSAIVASGVPVRRLTSSAACRTSAACTGTADEVVTRIDYGPQTAGVGNNLLPVSSSAGAGDGSLTATTTYGYDAIGNLVSQDGPLAGNGDTTTWRYDALRRPVGTILPDPDGAGPLQRLAARTVYDTGERYTQVETGTVADASDTGWNGFVLRSGRYTGYDAQGRVFRRTLYSPGVDHGVWDYLYDALGRQTCSIAYMDPAVWGPQASSCVPLQTGSANGPDRVTRTAYDALGRVVTVTNAVGTAAQSVDATTSYTPNGQTLALSDAENNRTTYAYDGFDRLVRTSYPVATVGAGASSATDYEQLGYDASGNVVTRRLRDGGMIAFGYDALDRAVTKTRPSPESAVSYGYDLLGQLLTAVDPGGTSSTLTYDALGRLTSDGQGFGSLVYQYDLAGRRTRQTWQDGFYVSYDYDSVGNMTAVRENGATSGAGVLATYAYDSLGRRTSLTRGNGTTTNYTFDAVSRLASLSQNLAGTAADATLGFSYTPAGQIAGTTRSNDAYAWTGAANVVRPYTVNGLNQATQSGNVALNYDARGNLSGSGSTTYAYSSENLLKSVSNGTTLYYDPFGRLSEYDTTVSTRFIYDGGQMAAEIDNPSGAVTRRFVHGPGADEALVQYEGPGTNARRWLHADERGSIIALSDASGAVVATNAYDEYGVPRSGNVGRLQYTGQASLAELGLYYYKARMYSPTLGRFLQTDPIGYADGMNWYGYVGGDPVNGNDSGGLGKDKPKVKLGRTNSDGTVDWTSSDGRSGTYDPKTREVKIDILVIARLPSADGRPSDIRQPEPTTSTAREAGSQRSEPKPVEPVSEPKSYICKTADTAEVNGNAGVIAGGAIALFGVLSGPGEAAFAPIGAAVAAAGAAGTSVGFFLKRYGNCK